MIKNIMPNPSLFDLVITWFHRMKKKYFLNLSLLAKWLLHSYLFCSSYLFCTVRFIAYMKYHFLALWYLPCLGWYKWNMDNQLLCFFFLNLLSSLLRIEDWIISQKHLSKLLLHGRQCLWVRTPPVHSYYGKLQY